jgi:hypothetical protein
MDNNMNVREYETPRIEDHGDLTELTAAGSVGSYFDGEFTVHKGEGTSGHLQTSP